MGGPILVSLLLVVGTIIDAGHDATPDELAQDTGGNRVTDGAVVDGALPAPPPDATSPPPPVAVLRGRVLETGTRRPLSNAVIAVDGTPLVESDARGAFETNVAPGLHHLRVQVADHEPSDRKVEVRAGGADEIFRLSLSLTDETYQTTVHSRHNEQPTIQVGVDEARRVPGTSGDPLRVLGSLPGVSQIVWPTALYVVRGANPGNTGFFLDGVRVPALFHLALGPSVVHPYLVADVDFFPGGYPANFGGAVSGIMSVHTQPPPVDRVHASGDVTLFDAGGIVTAPWDDGRGTVALAARYSYAGALLSALNSDTVLRYGDYQLRIDHPVLGGQGAIFAFGSLDQLGWRDARRQDAYGSLQFHRFDTRWRRPMAGGRLQVGLTLGLDWSGSTLFDRPIKVRSTSAAPRLSYGHPLGSSAGIEVGADANAQLFAGDVPDFQRRPSDLSRSRRAFSQGVYSTVTLRLGTRWVISGGVRGDLFAEQGVVRLVPEPRLTVAFRATPAVTLRFDGGQFSQMPSLPVSVAGFESFGLADLGLQRSTSGSVGVEALWAQNLTFGLTAFYQRLRLTDVRDIDISSLDPAAPDFLVSRRGRAGGVELLLRRAQQGRVFGWLAYTLSWAQRQDDSGIFGQSDWDQRHILNLVAGWRPRRNYSVGARFHYNTGRNAAVVNGAGLYRQLPAFYDLDLRAERRFVLDRFLLDVYLDLANVTLTRQVVQYLVQFDQATRQDRVIEQGFRIVLPTVGVHGEF